jgi:hypothetical protein
MCTTTTHYETHISTECSLGGSGQCDGYCDTHGTECTCSCHSDWGTLPDSIPAVRDWHDEQEAVKASFDIAYPGGDDERAAAWALARAEADRRNNKDVDGTVYKVVEGQGRVVVVWRS